MLDSIWWAKPPSEEAEDRDHRIGREADQPRADHAERAETDYGKTRVHELRICEACIRDTSRPPQDTGSWR